MVTNDDKDGNYVVNVYAIKKRVNNFQTRTRDDAIEEAWKVYRRRQMNTNTQTRRVEIFRIWKTGKRFSDFENITMLLRERWNKEAGLNTND